MEQITHVCVRVESSETEEVSVGGLAVCLVAEGGIEDDDEVLGAVMHDPAWVDPTKPVEPQLRSLYLEGLMGQLAHAIAVESGVEVTIEHLLTHTSFELETQLVQVISL